MIKNKNDLVKKLSDIKLYEGKNIISIIFHNGEWKDIFITNYIPKKDDNSVDIINSGFNEIFKTYNKFPEYGQVEFLLLIKNKKIFKYRVKQTNRVHNKN